MPDVCPVLGIPMSREGRKGNRDGWPSLDRLDNVQGYTRDNVRIISYRANSLKRDATPEELRAVLRYMEGN